MKTANSFGIYFTVRPDKIKEGKVPVYVCITVNGKKIFMALKNWVNLKQWDARKGSGKASSEEGKKLNNYLEDIRNELGDCYRALQVNRKIITADSIKQAFQRTGEEEHTLKKLVNYHNTTASNTLAWGTLKNYFTTQKYLELFLKDQMKAKDLHLSELNYKLPVVRFKLIEKLDGNKEIKLCMILIFSILRKYSTLTYMHNLKTNFDKILDIAKSTLSDLLLPEGNFEPYRNKPKMTDIEVVALAITAESLGIDSENLLFSKLRKEYLADFPRLIDRSNYNRRRKRLQDYIAWVAQPVADIIAPGNKQFILDSVPVPICQNPRIYRSSICRDDPEMLPQRGYHASHKMHYYGFKMQLVVSRAGVPVSIGLTPANIHDVHYLGHLDRNQLHDCELIADKGYLSAGHQASLFEQDRIRLITPCGPI